MVWKEMIKKKKKKTESPFEGKGEKDNEEALRRRSGEIDRLNESGWNGGFRPLDKTNKLSMIKFESEPLDDIIVRRLSIEERKVIWRISRKSALVIGGWGGKRSV